MIPNRSYHFIPANKPDWFDRVDSLGADAWIFDLEDAVPGEEKANALVQFTAWYDQRFVCKNNIFLRVNGCEHPLAPHEARVIGLFPQLGIVLPKVETSTGLSHAADFYDLGENRSVIGLIESPLAFKCLDSILEVGLLSGIGLGLEDLLCRSIYSAAELSDLVRALRTQLALSAMARGLEAIDTVSLDLSGGDSLRADAEQARSSGCTGKFSIHPNQIPPINSIFSPEETVIAQARELEEFLHRHTDEAGYIRLGQAILSPPKIKKLKHILQFAKHHDR
jgi:citrate lyase subunit beta/citryl-CoA lyase